MVPVQSSAPKNNPQAASPAQQSQPAKNLNLQKVLTILPYEKGFHFYTALDKYTGVTAVSLAEFAQKFQTIPIESVIFHFQRNDIQRWIQDVLGDTELAQSLDQLKKWPSWSSDENLRKEILKTLQRRLHELKPTQ